MSPGFQFTPRSRAELPLGFPDDIEGICYFLDKYVHPTVFESEAGVDHVMLGAVEYGICDQEQLVKESQPPKWY